MTLNWQWVAYFCLQSAGIKGICHHAQFKHKCLTCFSVLEWYKFCYRKFSNIVIRYFRILIQILGVSLLHETSSQCLHYSNTSFKKQTNICKTYHIRPLSSLKIDFRVENVYDWCGVCACNHRTHESETKASSHLKPVWTMQVDPIPKC